MRKLLIATMLLGSVHLSANNISTGKQFVGKLQRVGTAALLGLTLALTVPQIAAADNDHFTAVTAEDPAYQHSVMLLRSTNAEDETDIAVHLVYVGNDADGNAVLIGREAAVDSIVQDYLLADSNYTLYGWDGVIAENFNVEVADVFTDKTNGIFNAIALTVEGADLSNYPSVAVDSSFPYDSPVDLELLTYRLAYSTELLAKEIEAGEFTLRKQACNLEPNAEAAKVAIGFTTCGNPAGFVALGSLIFHEGIAVAFQSRPTGRLDMNAWLAAGIPQSAVDFVNAINGINVTAVEARGKVATTWGALKKGTVQNSQ